MEPQDRLAQALAEQRHQDAVRRAGGRILGNAGGRREEAANHRIGLVRIGQGDDHGLARPVARLAGDAAQRRQVGLQPSHRRLVLQHRDQIGPGPDLGRRDAQGVGQALGNGRPMGRIGGEVHLQPLAVAPHRQRSRQGVEGQQGNVDAHLGEQRVGRRQGGVAAQRRLARRGEPAQAKTRRILGLQQIGRLGLIVLGRQGLKSVIGRPGVEGLDHAGGIALERAAGEGVDGPLAHGETPAKSNGHRCYARRGAGAKPLLSR